LSSPLASVAFLNATIFSVHGWVVKQFENRQSLTAHFVAGFAAGYAQSFLASPSELLKLRVQLQHNSGSSLQTPLTCLKQMLNERRMGELKRGMFGMSNKYVV